MPYYSQIHGKQDKFFNERVFKGKKNGVFIDIGAHNGIQFSNSYFFETELDWTGVCVEPNPIEYERLVENRSCICEQLCVYNKNGVVEFTQANGSEMLSGISEHYDPRHLNRMNKETKQNGGQPKTLQIPAETLTSICERHNITHVDFCSIDVEGAELQVLQGIDFDKVTIDYLCVENNFNERKFENYLKTQGYKKFAQIGHDEVFQRVS